MTNDFINPLPGVPHIESPFFDRFFAGPEIDSEIRRIASDLHKNGFAVFNFPDDDFDRIADAIKFNLHNKYDWQKWRSKDKGGLRLRDAWRFDDNVKRLATNQKVANLLTALFGRKAWPFQTLNFPVGTQQHYHSDCIHFSSVPERFMCGVWTALEDISEDSGPLIYYPGSHKWPVYSNEHIGAFAVKAEKDRQKKFEPLWEALVEIHDAKPAYFTPKKGESLIWLANLLHGGHTHHDKSKTRWSQVTHYFFENCAYYTPLDSTPFYGMIDFRETENIITGQLMPNMYAGRKIPKSFIDTTRAYELKLPEGFTNAEYLEANPGVRAAGVDPVHHYLTHGWREGRAIRPEKKNR